MPLRHAATRHYAAPRRAIIFADDALSDV